VEILVLYCLYAPSRYFGAATTRSALPRGAPTQTPFAENKINNVLHIDSNEILGTGQIIEETSNDITSSFVSQQRASETIDD